MAQPLIFALQLISQEKSPLSSLVVFKRSDGKYWAVTKSLTIRRLPNLQHSGLKEEEYEEASRRKETRRRKEKEEDDEEKEKEEEKRSRGRKSWSIFKQMILKLTWWYGEEKNKLQTDLKNQKHVFLCLQLSLRFDLGVHKLPPNLFLMSNEIWRGQIMTHTSHSLSFVIISISEWLRNVSRKSGDKSVGIESYRLTVGCGCMPEAWLS